MLTNGRVTAYGATGHCGKLTLVEEVDYFIRPEKKTKKVSWPVAATVTVTARQGRPFPLPARYTVVPKELGNRESGIGIGSVVWGYI